MWRALYRAIRHELGLKLLSLLAAIALWLHVMNTENPYRGATLSCAVRPFNVPDGLEVTKIRPETIEVRVQGRLTALDRTRLSSLRAMADLSHGKPGRNEVKLYVAGLPDRITIESTERDTAQIWLDHRVAERFPVKPVIVGKPMEGSGLLSDVTVDPARVRISGSSEAIESVASVVVRVDVTGMSGKQTVSRRVEALDARQAPVQGVTVTPQQVRVELPIYRVTTKEVPVRARIGAPMAGYTLSDVRTSPDTVTLKGPPEALRGITEITTAWQSIRDLRTSKAYRAPLVIPAGVWPLDDVRSVLVRVSVRPVAPAREEPAEGNGQAEPDEQESGEPREPQATEPEEGQLAPAAEKPGARKPETPSQDQTATERTGSRTRPGSGDPTEAGGDRPQRGQ